VPEPEAELAPVAVIGTTTDVGIDEVLLAGLAVPLVVVVVVVVVVVEVVVKPGQLTLCGPLM
jgi:hypothetical protein